MTDSGASTKRPFVFTEGDWAILVPLQVDTAGLLFVEARKRVHRGSLKLSSLRSDLDKHRRRVTKARSIADEDAQGSAWVDVIQGVGSLEPTYGATISELLVADVLLVAAAEAYINAIAGHILGSGEAEQFDKLTPVGKWLFLPKLLKLRWQPNLARPPLQQFAALVARRNRVIHPKVFRVKGVAAVEEFLETLRLDTKSAAEGVAAVKGLIQKISMSWRGSYGPDWLDEVSSKKRPPCFVSGGPETPGRLAQLSPRKRRAGV
jgi:hypothetical protein